MNNKKILSKGWKLLALNEICDLQNGYAFKSNDYINISNTLNCRMSNIRPDGFFDIEHNQKFLPDSYIEKYKQYLLKDGDVIIAMTDMATEAKILGVPTIVKTQGKNLLLNQRVGKLIIKKPDLINFPYLKYALNREQVKKYFLKFAGGGLQINLGKEDILSVEIPLPPIAEQKRIAEILDRTQSLISKRKEAIAKLETLTQSIFLELYYSSTIKLKEVALVDVAEKTRGSFVNGPFGSDLLTSELQDHGVPVIYIRDIRNGEYQRVSQVCVSEKKAKDLAVCSTYPRDVLVAKVGDPPGISAIYPKDEPNAIITQDVIRIRVDPNIAVSEYIVGYLNSSIGRWKLSGITIEATRARFSLGEFKQLKINIPPLQQQKEFAQRIEAVEKLKARHRASLSQLQALFASLQHRAFRGEL